jgi:hypothetical protein
VAHERGRLDRRRFLQVGALAGLGLTLGDALRLDAARADTKRYPTREGAAQSVIHIFLPGGLAHQDSFDPKPRAPAEYRGQTRAIPTALDGVQFSALLPKTAKIADRLTLCRAMSHTEAAHERGVHNVLTGYRPSPAVVFPSLGSVVSHELGGRQALPPYVCVPTPPSPYAGSGYLSPAFGPFSVGGNPEAKDFRVRDLAAPKGVDGARQARRRELLDAVGAHFRAQERAPGLDAMDGFYARAYELLSSKHAREAFDLGREPKALRDRYGRHAAGQRLLLARRLVAAGVRFVTVTYGSWDHHEQVREGLERQLPPLDQAYAALIQDLDAQGLLDSTLVLLTTEFGRTPKLNDKAGRDQAAGPSAGTCSGPRTPRPPSPTRTP